MVPVVVVVVVVGGGGGGAGAGAGGAGAGAGAGAGGIDSRITHLIHFVTLFSRDIVHQSRETNQFYRFPMVRFTFVYPQSSIYLHISYSCITTTRTTSLKMWFSKGNLPKWSQFGLLNKCIVSPKSCVHDFHLCFCCVISVGRWNIIENMIYSMPTLCLFESWLLFALTSYLKTMHSTIYTQNIKQKSKKDFGSQGSLCLWTP